MYDGDNCSAELTNKRSNGKNEMSSRLSLQKWRFFFILLTLGFEPRTDGLTSQSRCMSSKIIVECYENVLYCLQAVSVVTVKRLYFRVQVIGVVAGMQVVGAVVHLISTGLDGVSTAIWPAMCLSALRFFVIMALVWFH